MNQSARIQSADDQPKVGLAQAAWTVDDAYLFGRDLLVAPVLTAGATVRAAYWRAPGGRTRGRASRPRAARR